MQDGSFETIQNKMTEMKMLDATGSFRGLKSKDKYRAAIAEINKDLKIMLDVIAYLEKLSINDLGKIEHSYGGHSTYNERLQPIITKMKIKQLGGKL